MRIQLVEQDVDIANCHVDISKEVAKATSTTCSASRRRHVLLFPSSAAGSLMDHIGGYINPLALIRRLPKGLTVPRLRDRLRSIIGDFRTQTSLHEGCSGILRSDCMHLMHKWVEGGQLVGSRVEGFRAPSHRPPLQNPAPPACIPAVVITPNAA